MKITQVLFVLCSVGYSQVSFAQKKEIEREIKIKAIAGLKFDLTRIKMKPGERIKLSLTNIDDMDHNLVITKPGARQEVVDASHKLGENGPKQSYVPQSDNSIHCFSGADARRCVPLCLHVTRAWTRYVRSDVRDDKRSSSIGKRSKCSGQRNGERDRT